ncbi:MAG: Chromosome segregation protein ScpB [Cypionkella sp.]|nr:Chromosome segregation protein ScpB [Cypionkella sp.]
MRSAGICSGAGRTRQITTGPARAVAAPYTFVTPGTFLAAFGMESLRKLADPEQLADAGLSAP